MSIEDDLQKAEGNLATIEKYLSSSSRNPQEQSKIEKMMKDSTKILDELINGHVMNIDVLAPDQIEMVSDLRARLLKARSTR